MELVDSFERSETGQALLVVADGDVSLNSDSSGMPNTNTWTYNRTAAIDWLRGQTVLSPRICVYA
jgi:hypothetical protein